MITDAERAALRAQLAAARRCGMGAAVLEVLADYGLTEEDLRDDNPS